MPSSERRNSAIDEIIDRLRKKIASIEEVIIKLEKLKEE